MQVARDRYTCLNLCMKPRECLNDVPGASFIIVGWTPDALMLEWCPLGVTDGRALGPDLPSRFTPDTGRPDSADSLSGKCHRLVPLPGEVGHPLQTFPDVACRDQGVHSQLEVLNRKKVP